MTTSGVATFNPSRDDIIRRALRICGAIQSGEAGGAQEIQDASDALNAWVKEQETSGLHLWKETEGVAFLQPFQYNYGLGGGSADHVCFATELQSLILADAEALGATSITINGTSSTAMNSQIGLLLGQETTGNILFWTTVNSISVAVGPNGTTTTYGLADPLPSALAVNSLAYTYLTPFERPLRLVSGRRFQLTSNIETPMIMMSRIDYREQPNKTTTGVITQYFYDPQLVTGQLWVWPNPSDSTNAFKFTWMRSLQDFLTSANTPDFPQEWINVLVWNLAMDLMPEYDLPQARVEYITKRAMAALELAQTWDKEPESLYFGVNFDQTVR